VNRHQGKGYFNSICFTPDGKSLVIGTNRLIWEIVSGKSSRPIPLGSHLSAVALSADGTYLAGTEGNSHEIVVWNLRDGKEEVRLAGHQAQADGARCESIRFVPGDRYLISGSSDGSIRIWDRQTGKEIAHRDGLKHLANHVLPLPDGRSAVSFGAWYLDSQPDPATSDWNVHLWRLPESVWPKEQELAK